MKVCKLTHEFYGTGYCDIDPKGMFIEIKENAEVGDKFTIEVVEMSEEEYEKLPEFDGF